jgi:septum formation protein
MSDTTQIILASASPRRRELLAAMGVEFIVMPANVNEDPLPGETPLETQHRITREKAQSAIQNLPQSPFRFLEQEAGSGTKSEIQNATIIACDTTVLLDGEMLNKPADANEARSMLRRLRGRAHDVQSAIVIRQGDAETIDIVASQVVMRDYSDEEIEAYIATGNPFDKAGSYAVQHPQFSPVQAIRGCPLNVIGLALCHVRARLPQLPASEPVCAAWFGKPCPGQMDDASHTVSGQMQR